MHRSASVAMGLLMITQCEHGIEGLARVFSAVVSKRPVIRPSFWPVLESAEFAELASRLRASAGNHEVGARTAAQEQVGQGV
jgi:hypothetical protein